LPTALKLDIESMADITPKTEAKPENQTLCDACIGKGTFFPHLVHELRNLMAPMSNAIHLIRLRSGTDPAVQQVIQIMERQIKGIGRALDTLSMADRLARDAVVLEPQPVELASILSSAVQAAQPLIDSRKQQLHLAEPPAPVYLHGSAAHLAGVLGDVLDNASKFTAENGQIWVDAAAANDEVRISVRDNGIGIPAELLSQVFSPYNSPNRTAANSKKGLGLSLAIARKIVELHRGRIDVASDGLDRGSEFVIRLPLRHAQPAENDASGLQKVQPAVADARAPQLRGEPKRILVVDDSNEVRASLCNILQEMGHAVRVAADGAEAIAIAREWLPAYVLLDIHIPKLNGYEVARELRSEFPTARMGLVMMSGASLSEAMLRGAKEAGFDHCVDKMQAFEQLEKLLATATPSAPAAL
jgi:CheY-like chemotaxis protein